MDVRLICEPGGLHPILVRGRPSLSLHVGTDLGGPGFQPRGPGAVGGDSSVILLPGWGGGSGQLLYLSLFICCLSDHSFPEQAEIV